MVRLLLSLSYVLNRLFHDSDDSLFPGDVVCLHPGLVIYVVLGPFIYVFLLDS